MQFTINKKVVDPLYSYLIYSLLSQPFDKRFVNIKFMKKILIQNFFIRISDAEKCLWGKSHYEIFHWRNPYSAQHFYRILIKHITCQCFLCHFKKKLLSECSVELFHDIFFKPTVTEICWLYESSTF